ncbi:unnamed protein product, partial [Ectocarpus sp. 13 AM-2016]
MTTRKERGGGGGEWGNGTPNVRRCAQSSETPRSTNVQMTRKERQQRGHRTYIRHKLRSTNARMIRKEEQHRTYFGTSQENTHCRWAAEMLKCDTAVCGLSLSLFLTIAIFCRTTAGGKPTESMSWNF